MYPVDTGSAALQRRVRRGQTSAKAAEVEDLSGFSDFLPALLRGPKGPHYPHGRIHQLWNRSKRDADIKYCYYQGELWRCNLPWNTAGYRKPVTKTYLGVSGVRILANGSGAPCAKTTALTEMHGTTLLTTRPGRGRIAGVRMGSPESAVRSN